jgi:CRP-like cAMP-binding protein
MTDPLANQAPNGTRNRLLASLPAGEYARLAPYLERVDVELKHVCFDVDQPIEHVYFPEAAVVSILSVMADGSSVETATVGREGMVGLPVFLGSDRTSAHAFVQVPGPALRMMADAFRAAVGGSPALTLALHRYTQALFTLVAQGSACNRLHTMTARCARWLLHTHDRVGAEQGADAFPLTHQFLSQMMGVRRATVTETMGALQASGAIMYEMGRVRVRDRAGLESAACECYAIIVREFDRLLAVGPAAPPSVRSPLDGVPTSEHGRSIVGDAAPSAGVDEPGAYGRAGTAQPVRRRPSRPEP